MRLCRFHADATVRLGLVDRDTVIELTQAAHEAGEASFGTATGFIGGGARAIAFADAVRRGERQAARYALASLRLAEPLVPTTILCAGSNYTAHLREKANTPISGKEPEFFIKTSDCTVAPGDAIPLDDRLTHKLDAEVELAIVIGNPGRHIPRERALDHVFGYTIVNDVTARDRQVRRNAEGFTWYELGRAKVFDGSAPIGPWIVTADEIPDPQALRLRTRVNGELRQSASTASMIFSCAELISFFSINLTLKPGMVIITGTPSGTAWSTDAELGGKWFANPENDEAIVRAPGYLARGDRVECEIDAIGVLANRIV